MYISGLSSLGVPGVPWHTQILAGQLTLFQPGGTDYAHLITTGTSGFSDLPTALNTTLHLFWTLECVGFMMQLLRCFAHIVIQILFSTFVLNLKCNHQG